MNKKSDKWNKEGVPIFSVLLQRKEVKKVDTKDKSYYIAKYYKYFIILFLFFIAINISSYLGDTRNQYFPTNLDRPMGLQIMAEMMGEVRTILASYLYITADMYHHEREDKVAWNRDPATLPLYRLITALDPKMENAYDFGAYHLAVNFKKYKQAIEFLQEGLHYNPGSFQLRYTMGDIYYTRGDYESSLRYYERAVNYAHEPEDMRNVFRRLYWCSRKLKRYADAQNYIEMWLQLYPQDVVGLRLEKEIHLLISGAKTEEEIEKERKIAIPDMHPDEQRGGHQHHEGCIHDHQHEKVDTHQHEKVDTRDHEEVDTREHRH